MRTLVVTAVAAECDAYLRSRLPDDDVVVAGGVGPAAGVTAAALLAREPFGLVLSVGIAGGFRGRADVGDLVVADRVIAADLGAESGEDDGFLTLDDLGMGSSTRTVPSDLVRTLEERLRQSGRRVVTGPVLSVSTVTGTDRRAHLLAQRWAPVAEAMEGYAVGIAAEAFGVPFAEVRAVSNPVGRRDRSAWDLPAAFAALADAGRALAVTTQEGPG